MLKTGMELEEDRGVEKKRLCPERKEREGLT